MTRLVVHVANDNPNGVQALRGAAAVALIVTVILGAVSNVLFLAAFQFRWDWFADPALLVTGGARSGELLRWASITDLLSYYLPTAIVALALDSALRPRGPLLARASMLAGLGYVLAGAIGAAVLATAGPALAQEYERPGADKAAVAIVFALLIDVVFRGIWQLLNGVLLGVWWFGIACLTRADQPSFARLSAVLAAVAWIGTAFNVLGFGLARDATLGILFLLWAIWSVWLARLLWRRPSPFADPTADGDRGVVLPVRLAPTSAGDRSVDDEQAPARDGRCEPGGTRSTSPGTSRSGRASTSRSP